LGARLNTYRVGKWLSLVANFGVLVGIVFLALEIRQANRIAIATTEISIRSEFKALNELVLANDDIARLLVRALDADADFSPVDTEKLYAYLYACINNWLGIEIAYVNGMITEMTFKVALQDVREILRYYPALQPLMRNSINDYPPVGDTQVYATIREVLADAD